MAKGKNAGSPVNGGARIIKRKMSDHMGLNTHKHIATKAHASGTSKKGAMRNSYPNTKSKTC